MRPGLKTHNGTPQNFAPWKGDVEHYAESKYRFHTQISVPYVPISTMVHGNKTVTTLNEDFD